MTDDEVTIDRLTKPVTGQSVSDVVSDWIDLDTPTLLAIDAPLGWPEALGDQLSRHKAGSLIDIDSNDLFRRNTDKFIKITVGKQPLDVGADRIARTAHAALKYLDDIGQRVGLKIPLAWDADLSSGISAIEVYPAATLKLSGVRFEGYKKTEQRSERIEIVKELYEKVRFETDISVLEKDDDVLDASVCVLAGSHFLRNQCIQPDDLDLARKEGWIWVKGKDSR